MTSGTAGPWTEIRDGIQVRQVSVAWCDWSHPLDGSDLTELERVHVHRPTRGMLFTGAGAPETLITSAKSDCDPR